MRSMRPESLSYKDLDGENKDWRKVIAISDQLIKDDLPKNQPQAWASEWVDLKNHKLSPVKTKAINREEWFKRIYISTVFIIGFLSGLDPQKLKL